MADDGYAVPAKRVAAEHEVQNSRFIAVADRVRSRADMDALIESTRLQYPKASHYCWAFVAGAPGDSHQVGQNDDGEPHGTAGQPMLTVLLHSDIGEIGVVVVRYFGGTKLGKGGLSRAYSDGTNQIIGELPTRLDPPTRSMRVSLDYASADRLAHWLAETDVIITDREFAATVTLHLSVPVSLIDALDSQLQALGASLDLT